MVLPQEQLQVAGWLETPHDSVRLLTQYSSAPTATSVLFLGDNGENIWWSQECSQNRIACIQTLSKQPTANTLWSNCTSTAWSPSTQKQQDLVSVNTHKNIFPVTNSFTNPSGFSGQWYVDSAQPQAVPNLLQGYHMEALSITADTLGLLPYKLVNHSTTNPSVRHSSEKKANDNLHCIERNISVKDEKATAVFLWDTACSSHHPYSRNTNSNSNECKNDWGGCGSDGGRSLSLQTMMKEVGYFKLENYLDGFHASPSFPSPFPPDGQAAKEKWRTNKVHVWLQ